jgi:hypothetical protein
VPDVALTELGVGLGGGILTALGAAGLFLRRKTAAMDEEKTRLDEEHAAKIKQQGEEHTARLELLRAERDKAKDPGVAAEIAALITSEVERLLPEAVAKLQAEERLRAAVQAQQAEAQVSVIRQEVAKLLKEIKP